MPNDEKRREIKTSHGYEQHGHGQVRVVFTTGEGPTGLMATVQRLENKLWAAKIDGSQRGGFSPHMRHARR